jgi:TonB family protein
MRNIRRALIKTLFCGATALILSAEIVIAQSEPKPSAEKTAGSTELSTAPGFHGKIGIVSDAQGVNFDPYVSSVFKTIHAHWLELVPDASLLRKQEGNVTIEFSIARDGKLEDLKFLANSGEALLDRAAQAGILASSPFPALPAEFKGPSIRLRLNFAYRPWTSVNIDSGPSAPETSRPDPAVAQEAPSAPANASPSIPLCKPQALEYPDRMVQPEYPEAALKAGIEGAVELRALVGSNGKTRELTLVKGDPVFAVPAVQAVRKWRFHPVLVKGKPVETVYGLRVRFVLILREAVTDLKIESPLEDEPTTGDVQADVEFDTPEGHVYRVSKQSGVVSPKIIYQRDPEFSEKARELWEQGTVTISLIVGTDGKPRNLKVECSSAPDLNENSLAAVKEWRFQPGTKDGKPVMVGVSVNVDFYLGGGHR